MEKTININGKAFSIEELNKLVEDAKKNNPMAEVFAYHGTTEEEFNNLYKNIPNHVKAYEKECMVVAWYNKGKEPDFNDDSRKYYPYFNMQGEPSCYGWYCNDCCSDVPARLLFLGEKAKENMLEAVEKFIDVYKESRKF